MNPIQMANPINAPRAPSASPARRSASRHRVRTTAHVLLSDQLGQVGEPGTSAGEERCRRGWLRGRCEHAGPRRPPRRPRRSPVSRVPCRPRRSCPRSRTPRRSRSSTWSARRWPPRRPSAGGPRHRPGARAARRFPRRGAGAAPPREVDDITEEAAAALDVEPRRTSASRCSTQLTRRRWRPRCRRARRPIRTRADPGARHQHVRRQTEGCEGDGRSERALHRYALDVARAQRKCLI